ncbi:MAG: hypothetical protein KKE20_06635, partial [Nanoarchaeota archaeon]|nr:hypothetical protein [Nanoarchaeota archaeon]
LIAPVKRTPVADCIFFGTHTDHHTVKWNGKEWEGFDFDENQEIDVYRGFGEYYCNVLVKEFRLKDSGLSMEDVQRTPPEKLLQKGLWSACDHYQKCDVRENPLIRIDQFDTLYCRYYQYINDRCPVEVMLSRDKT